MSRGVRDLRNIICVSRLTFHDGDEDEILSGGSSDRENINGEFAKFSLSSEPSELQSDWSNSHSPDSRVVSPDSGCMTSESPGMFSAEVLSTPVKSGTNLISSGDKSQEKGHVISKSLSAKSVKKRRKKKFKMATTTSSGTEFSQLEQRMQTTTNEVSLSETDSTKSVGNVVQGLQVKRLRTNFDDILTYMDAAVVANWLTCSNKAIYELANYCNEGHNFVQFAHFWLSEFSNSQKREIFSMEYEILLDEISAAFNAGRENGKVVRQDIIDICGAVFREYPLKLLNERGPHVFLDNLDTLSSEKQDRFKKLLSDVHCSTSNRQYAQWLLATRSFAVASMWSSVVNFYRNLIGQGLIHNMPILDVCSSTENVSQRRMLQAIRLGFVDVVNYLIVNGHVNPLYTDSHRKSLLFSAVMYGQAEIVRYLLTLDPPVIDVNQPADTGNTALHAAANSGNVAIIELLCQCKDVDIDCTNLQCDKATPLHLAVMHGHMKAVECLLQHGTNPALKMGNTTARELARDFGHKEILALLDKKQ